MINGSPHNCVLCDEAIGEFDAWVPLNQADDGVGVFSGQYAHHPCSLRSVLGGIGHQIAHEWWCLERHDPDAGLTYRQSAQMVSALVDVLGIDKVAHRG